MTDEKVTPLRPIHVLIVDDNDSDIFLVERALDTACPGEFTLTAAHSLEKALPALERPFDVALLDWALPGTSGMEAMKSLSQAAPKMAIVMLTGYKDESKALESLKHGAQDYLIKDDATGQLIKRSLRFAIERKRFEGNLITMANYDALTELANRNLFESRLDMALARGRRSGEPVGVLFLDLNGFKQVNDALGHEAGDALLKGVGLRLKQSLRECDTIARFGGDEFAVLLEGAGNPQNYAIVAQKMINALTPPFLLNGQETAVGVSIGIAVGAPDMTAEELMKQADSAMYRAKMNGASNYQFHAGSVNTETIERMQLEHELAIAIRQKTGLCLLYQPRLDIATGALVGAEALLRWNHSKRGMMAPADFMHLLMPALAAELDQWLLETICRDIRCWQTAGLRPTQVSLHISNHRWENTGSAETLISIINRAGMGVQYMSVGIDELALLHYGGEGFDMLSRVRETSIEAHLDNAEGEVSSLKLMTHCQLDAVKIDRRLATGMNPIEQRALLRQALIVLGHRLWTALAGNGTPGEMPTALSHIAIAPQHSVIISKPLPSPEFFHWLGNRTRMAS